MAAGARARRGASHARAPSPRRAELGRRDPAPRSGATSRVFVPPGVRERAAGATRRARRGRERERREPSRAAKPARVTSTHPARASGRLGGGDDRASPISADALPRDAWRRRICRGAGARIDGNARVSRAATGARPGRRRRRRRQRSCTRPASADVEGSRGARVRARGAGRGVPTREGNLQSAVSRVPSSGAGKSRPRADFRLLRFRVRPTQKPRSKKPHSSSSGRRSGEPSFPFFASSSFLTLSSAAADHGADIFSHLFGALLDEKLRRVRAGSRTRSRRARPRPPPHPRSDFFSSRRPCRPLTSPSAVSSSAWRRRRSACRSRCGRRAWGRTGARARWRRSGPSTGPAA